MSVDFNVSNKTPVATWAMRISDADSTVLFDELSEEEKTRALRFRQAKDFERFVLAHSLKRFLLADYLGEQSHSLIFDVGDHGKPFCRHPRAPYFSISHSGEWVVIVLSLLSEVGVDVEFPRDLDYRGIVSKVCSPYQQEQFEVAGSTDDMFLCFWTQKEAIAKACGQGISVGLADIACSGHLGSEKVMFLQKNYWLWTYRWQNRGFFCFAATEDSGRPRCLVVTQFNGRGLSYVPYNGE